VSGTSIPDIKIAMEDSQKLRATERGAGLLMEHCAALERLEIVRISARARLEASLGDDLTRLLVGALTTSSERPLACDDEVLEDDSAA
jgi:hypothetical protein